MNKSNGLTKRIVSAIALAIAIPAGCDSSGSGVSGETHFVACNSDADCSSLEGHYACIEQLCLPQGDASASCVPGKQISCACPGGASPGVQMCLPDGSAYGECTGCRTAGIGGNASGGAPGNGGSATDASVGRRSDSSIDSGGSTGGSTGGAATSTGGRASDGGIAGSGGSSDSGRDASLGNDARPVSSDGGSIRRGGHLVLIGTLFNKHTADDERILENAIFLAPGSGAINVLEYVQYGGSTDAAPDVHTFVGDYATSVGRSVTFAPLDNYQWLGAQLPGFDVLLVYDQTGTGNSAGSIMTTIADSWNPTMNSFIDDGGVVVVLSGTQGTSRTSLSYDQTYRVATGAGLLRLPGLQSIVAPTYGKMEVTAPNSPIAAGVLSSYAADAYAHLAFPSIAGGTVVVRDHSTLNPVVIHVDRSTPCRSSLDCAGHVGKVCDSTTGRCVACQVDQDCKTREHCFAGTCSPPRLCASSSSCAGLQDGRTVCDVTAGECAECAVAADCGQAEVCTAEHTCRKSCSSAADCAAGTRRVCDTAAGVCAECLDSTNCLADHYCKLGRCFPDTCTPGIQACSGNAVYECDSTGSSMVTLTSCDVSVCMERGTTAACEMLPDAGPRCPVSCPPCFIAGPPGCCTPNFTCGCESTPGVCQ